MFVCSYSFLPWTRPVLICFFQFPVSLCDVEPLDGVFFSGVSECRFPPPSPPYLGHLCIAESRTILFDCDLFTHPTEDFFVIRPPEDPDSQDSSSGSLNSFDLKEGFFPAFTPPCSPRALNGAFVRGDGHLIVSPSFSVFFTKILVSR